jgi:apolipoprotein N-acyltransferase
MHWLIVSIHFYGEVDLVISIFLYLLSALLMSLAFGIPIYALKYYIRRVKYIKIHYIFMLIIFSLVTSEISMYKLLNGVPWLIPGYISIDTLTGIILPLFGVYGASLIIYLISYSIFLFYKTKRYYFLIPLILLMPYERNYVEEIQNPVKVSVIQPSSNPLKKYENDYSSFIEENLFSLINKIPENVQIIVLPEAELPYSMSDNRFKNFINKIDDKRIIMGVWEYNNGSLFNSMLNVSNNNIYRKNHLVPFGEYIPFESYLRGIIDFFNMPMSSVKNGIFSNEPFIFNKHINIFPQICFDIAFSGSYSKLSKNTNLIINISNDTWFGNSIGPLQHLNIARIRAIEHNKWLIRGTNDGISAIISNKGTIVEKSIKGETMIINGDVNLINQTSFLMKYGIYVLKCIYLIMTLVVISTIYKIYGYNKE